MNQDDYDMAKSYYISDAVVNSFGLLLAGKSNPNFPFHVYHSSFFVKLQQSTTSVRKWSKQVPNEDLFTLHHLFIPCNINTNHWVCIDVDFPAMTITYYDPKHADDQLGLLQSTLAYLKHEYSKRSNEAFPINWTTTRCTNIPVQRNSYDCAVYCCSYMEMIANQSGTCNFDSTNMPYFRQRIALAITQNGIPDLSLPVFNHGNH